MAAVGLPILGLPEAPTEQRGSEHNTPSANLFSTDVDSKGNPPITEPLPGRGKLSELVSHHLLADVYRQIILPVMDHKLESDKVGKNGTGPRPGVDWGVVLEGLLQVWEGREVGSWRARKALAGLMPGDVGCVR